QANILPDIAWDEGFEEFKKTYRKANELDFLSYQMFPKVFDDNYKHLNEYGKVEEVPTWAFFYPVPVGKEIEIKIAKGKVIHIKLVFISNPDEEGMRTVI